MLEKVNAKAAIWAGIVAGVVFMMLEMLLVWQVQGDSPWAPPRMIAAMAMGESVLPPPGSFDALIMAVAMAIHMLLSVILGFILGWAISNWKMGLVTTILVGTIFGLIIYFVNFYLFTAIFPWFAMARGAVAIFAHAVFGLVLGWTYRAIADRPPHMDEAVRDQYSATGSTRN
jgi:hypothetical protein